MVAALLSCRRSSPVEARDERLGHEFRDRVFELEHVGRALVEAAGPARRALAHVEQLRGDADAVAESADVAVHDVIDVQLAPGRERVEVAAAVAQHARRGAHDDALDAGEARDERVGESDAEVLVARVDGAAGAEDLEREDGDGLRPRQVPVMRSPGRAPEP